VSRLWRVIVAGENLAVDGLMFLCMAIMPLMALAITFEVVARRIFSAPTIWVGDASGFALLWIAFLAAPWLVRHDAHIRITFLTDRASARAQTVLSIITSTAGAAVMAVTLWLTWNGTLDSLVRNVHTVGTWEIPQYLVWMVMPVGSLFTCIEFVRSAWIDAGRLRAGRVARRSSIDQATSGQLT
jgi:TRAP-type C4-dicarboxylate transport system permease small subunit